MEEEELLPPPPKDTLPPPPVRVASAFSVGRQPEQEVIEEEPPVKDAGFWESLGKSFWNTFGNRIPKQFNKDVLESIPDNYDRLVQTRDPIGKLLTSDEEYFNKRGILTPDKIRSTPLDTLLQEYSVRQDPAGKDTYQILQQAKQLKTDNPELVLDFYKSKVNSIIKGYKDQFKEEKVTKQEKEEQELMKNVPTDLEDFGLGYVGGALGEGLSSTILFTANMPLVAKMEKSDVVSEINSEKAKIYKEKFGVDITPEDVAKLEGDEEGIANTVTAINMGLEGIGILSGAGKAVKSIFLKKAQQELTKKLIKYGLKHALKDISIGALGEGITGLTQDINVQIASKIAAGKSPMDAVAEVDFDRSFNAFVREALPGGMFGTVTATSNKLNNINQAINETTTGNPAVDLAQNEILNQELNAQTVRSDEGQVPQTGDVAQTGQDQGGQNIQQQTQETNDTQEQVTEPQEVTHQPEQPVAVEQETGTEFTPSETQNVEQRIREVTGVKRERVPVNTSEYVLLKDKIRTLARGIREGVQDSKKAVKEIGTQVSEIINKQQLTPTQQNAILKRATSVNFTKPEQVDKLLSYVDEVIREAEATEQQRLKEGIKKKALELTNPKKFRERSSSGVVKGKRVDTKVANTLGAINSLVKSVDLASVETQKQELHNKITDLSEAELDKLEALEVASFLLSDDLNSVNAGFDFIKGIEQVGRTNFRETLEQRRENNRQIREAAINDIAPQGVKEGFEAKKIYDSKKNVFSKFKEAVSNYLNRNEAWDFLLDIVSRGERQEAGFKSVLHNLAGVPIGNARAQYDAGVQAKRALLEGKLKELYGSKAHSAANKNSARKKVGDFIDANGNPQEIILSQNEAYYLYNLMQDPSLEATFDQMGYTQEMKDAVTNYMTPQVRQWADFLRTEFYPKYYPEINQVYKSIFLTDLPFNQNYTPLVRKAEKASEETLLGYTNNYVRVMNGSLKERTNNKISIEIKDGDSLLNQYLVKMEHFKAFAEPIQQLNTIFKDPKVREAIRQNNSSQIVQTIDKFIGDFAQNGVDRAYALDVIDKFRGNFSTAALGINPAVMYKQLTSFPAYAAEIPVTEFFKGVGLAVSNPVKAYNTIMKSPYIRERYSAGFDRDMAIAMATDYTKIMPRATLASRLMFLVHVGDAGAILLGGYGAYNYHYNKAKKAGKSNAEAEYIALREFEEITKKSQQSSNIEDLGDLQRAGAFAKLFTMFKTSPMQYFRHERKAVRDFVRGNDRSGAMKRFAIYHFVLPALFQYVSSGLPGILTDWDEEDEGDMIRALSVGSLNGLFIFGDLLWYMGDLMLNKPYAKNFNITPAFDNMADLLKYISEIGEKAIKEEDYTDALIKAGLLVGDMTGIPASRVQKFVDNHNFVENTYLTPSEQFLIYSGYSPYTVVGNERYQQSKSTNNEFYDGQPPEYDLPEPPEPQIPELPDL